MMNLELVRNVTDPKLRVKSVLRNLSTAIPVVDCGLLGPFPTLMVEEKIAKAPLSHTQSPRG